jgi:dsRNA-specific ribonuclease
MSGLSRLMDLSVRSLKFTGSSIPKTKSLRAAATALPGTRSLTDSRLTTQQQTPYFQEHLNHVFSPLHFPVELAKRILTHGSHSASIGGHNAGLSFMGRRVLAAYLQLFLHSSSALHPSDDVEEIMKSTLNTDFIGECVGREWGVGRVIRWTPSAPANRLADMDRKVEVRRQVGLYKVQGEAVEAIIGGIYFQFGGIVAQRVFHTRLLPHLLVNRGLPKVFHEDANSMRERMEALPLIVGS